MAERRLTAFDVRRLPGFAAIAVSAFVLLYLPIVILVSNSFNAGAHIGTWEGFSLQWYAAAWHNDAIRAAAARSLQLAVTAAGIAVVVATMAALATTRTTSFGPRRLIYLVISQPLMVPEIVMAVALLLLFSLVRQATGLGGMGYLVGAHATFCIPFAYMPIRARLEGMDYNMEIAAADLYAAPLTTFRRVTLPLLMPGILAGFMLAFVISLDNVVITQFVKSAGQETLPTFLLGQMRRGMTPEIYAVSTLLVTLSISIVSVFFVINRKER